jgi:hypothetical protein
MSVYNPPKAIIPIFNSSNFQYEIQSAIFKGGIVPNETKFNNSIVVGNGSKLSQILVYLFNISSIDILNGATYVGSNTFSNQFNNLPIINLTTSVAGLIITIKEITLEGFIYEIYNANVDYTGAITINVMAIESS